MTTFRDGKISSDNIVRADGMTDRERANEFDMSPGNKGGSDPTAVAQGTPEGMKAFLDGTGMGKFLRSKNIPVDGMPGLDGIKANASATFRKSVEQDWPNLKYYRSKNLELSSPKKNEKRVVFMGNSITEGWSTLQPQFFEGKPYINRGISGQTTPQMLIRFRQDVIDLQPKLVVILAGINDIAGNTGPSNVAMITNNIMSMQS